MATTVEIVLRAVGGGAVAIGVLTAYGTVRMRLKVGHSHKWPTVPGTIVSSELGRETERHHRKPITTYAAAIRYAYEVDGKAYESDQIQLGGTSENQPAGRIRADGQTLSRGQAGHGLLRPGRSRDRHTRAR